MSVWQWATQHSELAAERSELVAPLTGDVHVYNSFMFGNGEGERGGHGASLIFLRATIVGVGVVFIS